jgi:probable rRNA maturation factor
MSGTRHLIARDESDAFLMLSLCVQFVSNAKTLPSRAQIRRWAMAVHRVTAVDRGEVTIRYTDEREARVLNKQFRSKDYATNVLTFSHDLPADKRLRGAAKIYGADIVICAPVIAAEAKAQRKSVHEHHAHMVIHGLLHAQGFDHENARDAQIMETFEANILARFRIKNPYDA